MHSSYEESALSLIRPPALPGLRIAVGSLFETVRVADAAVQEIQRQEQDAECHVLIDVRAFVRAQPHALPAAELAAVVGKRRCVQALAGVEDHLAHGQCALVQESEV